MSDANRTAISYVKESTFGTTPATPTMIAVRYTKDGLKQETSTIVSAEIRSDRNTADIIRTDIKGSGDLGIELSYGAHDDLWEGVLQSAAWTSAVTYTAATIACTAAGTLTDSANAFVSSGLLAGRWARVSGFTGAGATTNAAYIKFATVAAGSLTFTPATFTADAAGESVTIKQLAQITTGTTLNSYSFEKGFLDAASTFSILTGLTVSTAAITITPGAIIGGSFGFLGKRETSASATVASSTTAAPTNSVLNAVDNVGAVIENGTALQVTNFSFNLNNNLRARMVVGTLGALSIGAGEISLTGTLQIYNAAGSNTLYDKYLNFTETSLAVRVVDGSGNTYIFDIPAVKFTAGERVASAKNTDVIVSLNWTAKMQATELITMRICRNPGP